MTTFLAFLHHVAAFGLVAALVAEMILLKDLAPANARRLAIFDAALGLCAVAVLVVGVLRVVYFEKGAAYYLHNAAFIAKMVAFGAIGLLSIYPTVRILQWRKGASIDAGEVRLVRKLVHSELTLAVLVLLFAAMMARGVGYYV
jgi:putative membrane protein